MRLASPSNGFSPDYPRLRRSKTVESAVNALDGLLVAFILALVFRAFAVEAFQIPTGSMAETLNGAHWHLRCLRCGIPYDFGADAGWSGQPVCPNCGYEQPSTAMGVLANGDRIFVNKCIYQFSEPKRWDVVVFKNPPNPQENYIKRLVGLPGESIEIADGDLYINGQIVRKPRKIQEELWTCLYHNDYQAGFASGRFSSPSEDSSQSWPLEPRFESEGQSAWELNSEGGTVFVLREDGADEHSIRFVPRRPDVFRVFYAYNGPDVSSNRPICSDLMIRFWVQPTREQGQVGALLSKNGVGYVGRFDFLGQLIFEKVTSDGQRTELRKLAFLPDWSRKGLWFEFANVDRRLVIRCGDYRFSYDLKEEDLGERSGRRQNPEVKILGQGGMRLSHIGVYRDIYYLSSDSLRARRGRPFQLGPDEFFVCGDNTPNSYDSRQWATEGLGNNGKRYREGVVPRDFMMGKAFFIYWSDAFRPREYMLPVIVNLERLRVIYGGSEEIY
ncbi:MAG TPA: signal peptidase I [Anaerohalosphaeraceae bacterium]|nr:signal peptidase I [Anaerohalosphaeraceae bacterium]HOL88470.1 signal peptidase I [Anaerohalosphaeraceae bacterium]HPP56953.1 signal peptidase I [Anaerohalosphaeraceae bacterium]